MRTESKAIAFRIGLSGPLRASKACKGACTAWGLGSYSPLPAVAVACKEWLASSYPLGKTLAFNTK